MRAATPIAATNATTETDTAMAEVALLLACVVPDWTACVVSDLTGSVVYEGMAKVGTAKIQVVTTMQ